MRVLLTRPLSESEKLAPQLEARGLEPLLNPLLEIAPLNTPLPDGAYAHLVFTSATVLEFIPDRIDRSLPLYCVGQQTVDAARRAGFTWIAHQAPTVEGLLPALRRMGQGTAILYPCGLHTAHDLAALLVPAGIAVKSWPLYETKFLSLTAETIRLLSRGEVAWILLFSRRTAEALAVALPQNTREWSGKVSIAAISEKAAAPVRELGWARLAVAARPTAAGVLYCLEEK